MFKLNNVDSDFLLFACGLAAPTVCWLGPSQHHKLNDGHIKPEYNRFLVSGPRPENMKLSECMNSVKYEVPR